MTMFKWSQTRDDNDDIDATINLREGQSPSTYNNAVRAVMAAAAKYRDDVSGKVDTGGTGTAYTFTSSQGYTSLIDGIIICFTAHATSGASPTMAVDGLTAKPLRGVSGSNLPAGVLSLGTPYMAHYDSSTDEWLLHGFFEPVGGVPIAGSVEYAGSTAPNTSWLLEYGQAVSRTTYATLFARIGTTYGAGDESTTFNIPDCRGRVVAGKDDMGGSSANRLTAQTGGLNGDTLGATGGAETHTLLTAQIPAHNHAVGTLATASDGAHTHTYTKFGAAGFDVEANVGGTSGTQGTTSSNGAHTHAISGSVANTGDGGAHNNVQPTIIKLKLIRAL